MQDQRRYMRANSQAQVEISHPSLGLVEFKAKDLSDGGVFVFLGNHIALPIGTLVKARIKRHTGVINEQPVDMQVVHHHSGGMGLMFV
ncbi:PilZ domain-containing protein [Oceanicoccus sp. KOV_DT_Chl]|uniref:PilZ domain-containing protein n=1 Tax=Oceanicoccus sp. KOV_DT_Chl TaxID=1904639 RepID=UPI000C7BB0DA|nr:PilZ domain-containing protein [Oceanicoccus sp. KOV_DT_Chl]